VIVGGLTTVVSSVVDAMKPISVAHAGSVCPKKCKESILNVVKLDAA